MKSIKNIFICACVSGAVALTGCASGPPRIGVDAARELAGASSGPTKKNYLAESYIRKAARDETNGALHYLHIGVSALQEGDTQLAERAFDKALLVIEKIYGGDASAQQARQKYQAESDKVFRGEPYERAMAYYYRGVLYLMAEDFENARASFRSAFLQDSLAGSHTYQQDFALLAYLEGWASQCNGDAALAKDAFAVARQYNQDLKLPSASADTLVLAEHGEAPIKYTEGKHDELLKIKASDAQTPGDFHLADSGKLANVESISFQATTRGGREFDAILKGQVQYKESAQSAADTAAVVADTASLATNVLIQSGAVDEALDSFGIGFAADIFSSVMKSKAEKTNPTADTRSWQNLPDRVHYGAYRAAEIGNGVQYGGYGVQEIGGVAKAVFQPLDSEEAEVVTQRGVGRNCALQWMRVTDMLPVAAAPSYPAFMENLNGCWVPNDFLQTFPPKEFKVIDSDTFLYRRGKRSKEFTVHKYQVTGENSWSADYSFLSGRFTYKGVYSPDRWVNPGCGGPGTCLTNTRVFPAKCGGLLLQ